MAIRKVARMGHPVLREKAEPVDPTAIGSEEIQRLILDMEDTMHEYGGVGLAGPQVHESLRIAVMEITPDNERYPDHELQEHPLTVMINPEVKVLDETLQGYWEGCLSVPGLRGFVVRPRKVQVDYIDREGDQQSMTAEDFFATVIQHELDHLDGVLYVDKLEDSTKLAFVEEFQKYWP